MSFIKTFTISDMSNTEKESIHGVYYLKKINKKNGRKSKNIKIIVILIVKSLKIKMKKLW